MGAYPSFIWFKYVLFEEIGGGTTQLRIFDYRCGGRGILEAEKG